MDSRGKDTVRRCPNCKAAVKVGKSNFVFCKSELVGALGACTKRLLYAG